jgi:hypothetical protein
VTAATAMIGAGAAGPLQAAAVPVTQPGVTPNLVPTQSGLRLDPIILLDGDPDQPAPQFPKL